jgi:hypothetical protein
MKHRLVLDDRVVMATNTPKESCKYCHGRGFMGWSNVIGEELIPISCVCIGKWRLVGKVKKDEKGAQEGHNKKAAPEKSK